MSSPRILLVEDQPLIRLHAVEALDDAGFEVAETASATEAMSRLREGEAFAAAIIDIGLPDRPGDALAAEIRTLWPNMPIVFASGEDCAVLADRFGADSRILIVSKPYNIDALSEALATLGVTGAAPLRPAPPG
jgi:CheY-like chemotaxis protein